MGDQRRERPAGRRPGPPQRPGEDSEEEPLDEAEHEVTEEGQRQRNEGKHPQEVDHPGVAAQVRDEPEAGASPCAAELTTSARYRRRGVICI